MEEGLRHSRPYADSDERILSLWLPGWAVPDLATGDEYVKWARDACFTDVQLDDVTDNTRRSLRRLYLISTLLYPAALARHPLRRLADALERFQPPANRLADGPPVPGVALERFESDRRFRNIRGGRLQWKALKRGLVFLGILSARKPAEPMPRAESSRSSPAPSVVKINRRVQAHHLPQSARFRAGGSAGPT
jgi:hypothetical protein